MDNPIVIGLLIVASIIYKVYESFKEEQLKAKTRMEKLKKQAPKQVIVDQRARKPSFQQEIVIPNPATFSKRERIDREHADAIEKYNRRKMEDKSRREELKTSKKPELEVLEDDVSFDLKQAIIQQAILNRPYA